MQRREFLKASTAIAGLSALGLTGCVKRVAAPGATALPFYDAMPPLVPIRAHEDRLFRITVCLRPFRAMGPRLDAEKVGDKLVVMNYGHGGSGWSLSWGSSRIAVVKALEGTEADASGHRNIAVIGCGALGLTSAITAQRMGARVTIYARERPPEVRSARATGSWTPDSRVALTSQAAPEFGAMWEQMARTSWAMYQSYLGMPGPPIEYMDTYGLSDEDPQISRSARLAPPPPNSDGPHLDFARYADRIADLTPRFQDLPPGSHPFPTRYCARGTTLTFNVADYSRQLYNDFLIAGGVIETADFKTPTELAALPQKTIISCTGYGSRALWSDESITPVRGQIGWLIPQPDVHYAIYYRGLNVLARRDGIVIQTNPGGERAGWNVTDETPDRAEAEAGVRILQELYSRMKHA